MQIALLAKNKLGFVDGSYSRESMQSIFQTQWDRCNMIVLSWILNSLNIDLSVRIVFATNVSQVWKDLKERYNNVDGSRILFLH